MKDKADICFWIFLKNQIEWYQLFFIGILAFFFSGISAQTEAVALVESSAFKKLWGLYDSNKPHIISKEKLSILPVGFPVNQQEYSEIIDKRTLRSRTYSNKKGEVVIQYSSKNLNYYNSGHELKPIDARLHWSTDGVNKDAYRWSALEQQYPTFLNEDGSTALSSETGNKIIFNRHCEINGEPIKIKQYTVGENGMLISNVIAGIDKKIIFSENRIETDYILHHPLPLENSDLVIIEEIQLPKGYFIMSYSQAQSINQTSVATSEDETFVVYSPDNREQARFNTPLFYDANKIALRGKYKLIRAKEKYVLQTIVPAAWLNAPGRVYPVTIDPIVTGPTSNFPSVFMNSCVLPSYSLDSMQVTIPAGITITGFIVEDSYFADALSSPPALMKHGKMMLSTVCGTVTFQCQGTSSDSSGTCYLVPNTDLKTDLACCFTPSCVDQTFYIKHGLGRDSYGPGCNQTYIYYSPLGNWPFSAYIVGRTVETTQAQWAVFPTTLCSDSCTIYLKVSTKYGVPPYTITHPWATGSSVYGASSGSCSSTGGDTIALTIPNCPSTCGTNPTLSIPPPEIKDTCGNTVTGLSPKSITVQPVPVATVNAAEACSNTPYTIPATSCVAGSTFQWQGNNGSSGTGDVADVMVNATSSPTQVNYTIIPEANGCIGSPAMVVATINPLPVITSSPNDTTDPGIGVQLLATGGLTYTWTPPNGLSCIDCANPIAAPTITTTYYVTGTNEYGCSSSDTLEIYVNQGTEVLYIPNSFSPDNNDVNDLFYVYGSSIKKIDIQIYDRWGELLFHTTDINQGWDGKYKGKNVEGGVYVCSVTCEYMSGAHTRRRGTVSVLR